MPINEIPIIVYEIHQFYMVFIKYLKSILSSLFKKSKGCFEGLYYQATSLTPTNWAISTL